MGVAAEPADPLAHEPYLLADLEGVANGRAGRLKADGGSTRGHFSVVVRGPYVVPGPESHTHSHLFEAWYVLEGAFEFQSRDRVFDVAAGSFVLVPPGVEHRFRGKPDQPVKVLQILSPPGFEKYLDERAKLPGYDPAKPFAEQS